MRVSEDLLRRVIEARYTSGYLAGVADTLDLNASDDDPVSLSVQVPTVDAARRASKRGIEDHVDMLRWSGRSRSWRWPWRG